jgi:YlmC/YmxH family sporulation protein
MIIRIGYYNRCYMRFSELKEKEVINCKDCCRLGFVADAEFDPCSGRITALIVPEQGKFFCCFGSVGEYYIDFCNVVRIGPDIVLVDIPPVLPKPKEC